MPTDPSNSVVHLTMRCGDNQLAIGTGVLYRKNERVFIVTAWHNVTGLHPVTLEMLSKTGSIPNNLVAYISCRGTNDTYKGYCRLSFTIPLEDSEKALYLIHPQPWPRIDIVAIPIDLQHPYESEGYLSDGTKVIDRRPMLQKALGPGLCMDIECIQDFEQAVRSLNVESSQLLAVSDELFIRAQILSSPKL
ncbi:MAG: hypothetical protein V1844_00500 [Pseudomonadota bacterium]